MSSFVDYDGTVHEFTIQKYCELCKTHQFNLYLLVKENPEVEDEQVKEDDSDLLIPVFGSPVEEKIPNLSLEAGQTECQPVVSSQFYHASSMSSVDDRSRRNRRSTPSSTSTSTGGTSGEETSFNWTLIGSTSDRRQLNDDFYRVNSSGVCLCSFTTDLTNHRQQRKGNTILSCLRICNKHTTGRK